MCEPAAVRWENTCFLMPSNLRSARQHQPTALPQTLQQPTFIAFGASSKREKPAITSSSDAPQYTPAFNGATSAANRRRLGALALAPWPTVTCKCPLPRYRKNHALPTMQSSPPSTESATALTIDPTSDCVDHALATLEHNSYTRRCNRS